MLGLILYLWQLPQNLLGLLFLLFIRGEERHRLGNIRYYYAQRFRGGISLGNYCILGEREPDTIRHEYGHQLQRKYLGPLYLLVVGLPSIIRAAMKKPETYYDFYTEKWADKLGGVKR